MILIWFRRDLRLADQEAFYRACQDSDCILPVYIFDPREFAYTPLVSLPKTDSFRARFLLESVVDIRESLQKRGADLVIRAGKPENVLSELISQYPQVKSIYTSKEYAYDECLIEASVRRTVSPIPIAYFETDTLYRIQDLPFEIDKLPDQFTSFRLKVEKQTQVRSIFSTPTRISTPQCDDWGTIPTLGSFGLEDKPISNKAVLKFKGGERSGLDRLNEYIWSRDLLKTYKQTRNGLIGADYSSKFSAWLAQGCLSPAQVYWEVKRYEQEYIANESTYWLIFELIWREFFRLSMRKYGSRLFGVNGITDKKKIWLKDMNLFESWCQGKTPEPFVNANMSELNETGFMSNRGRQVVASYLSKTLGIDWRWGAEYFESKLIDYDVCSNWGNWAYIAGVGHDPRDRIFNVRKQAQDYDPKGEYTNMWL
ncbi:MAG: DASH family cryptochrome [Candidatus Caenarcaniphilales bacterium]|nr:DASH family cryptochrome [Candidatus Caenarcaniphilales bacterium]